MTKDPSSKDPRLATVGQALKTAGKANDDPQMEAEGDRALKMAQKAMREGKAGYVTDGKSMAIIER